MQVFNNLLLKSIMDFKGNGPFTDDISILSVRFR
jgi:serine phosphatase RsbU (regulator of sigma subunit)